MATYSCSRVRFVCATNTGFHFEEPEEMDVEEDAFQKSVLPVHQYFLRSKDNKFLIMHEDGLQCSTLNKEQQHQPEYKLSIQIYKDSSLEAKKRRAVMLYSSINGKNMVVCCNDKREIRPMQMELPRYIGSNKHRAVFYRTELSTSRYMLESSWYPSEFLGFESDEENLTRSKLVLRHKEDGYGGISDTSLFAAGPH